MGYHAPVSVGRSVLPPHDKGKEVEEAERGFNSSRFASRPSNFRGTMKSSDLPASHHHNAGDSSSLPRPSSTSPLSLISFLRSRSRSRAIIDVANVDAGGAPSSLESIRSSINTPPLRSGSVSSPSLLSSRRSRGVILLLGQHHSR